MNGGINPRLNFLVEHLKRQKANGILNWRFGTYSAYLKHVDSDILIDFAHCWGAGYDRAVLRFPYNPNDYYVKNIDNLKDLLSSKDRLTWPKKIVVNDEPSDSEYARIMLLTQKRRLSDSEKTTISNYFSKIATEYTLRHPDLHYSSLEYENRRRYNCLAYYCDGIICVNKSLFDYCCTEVQAREVILHELCHSVYLSHGKRFWSLLNEKIVAEKLTEIQWLHPCLFNASKKEFPRITIPI